MNPFPTRILQAGAILGFLTLVVIGWKLADEPESPAARSPVSLRVLGRRGERRTGQWSHKRLGQVVSRIKAFELLG